jgi:hypothetical protein
MAEIILNSKYAPGVTTYGARGQEGKAGKDGKSIFFVHFDINENKDLLKEFIKYGKIFGADETISHNYQSGDSFIQPDGGVWMYQNDDLTSLGHLNLSNFESFFELKTDKLNNNYLAIKDSSIQSLLLTDNISNEESLSAILNLKCKNNSKPYNFLQLETDDASLSFSYKNYKNDSKENVSAFTIETKQNLFIDNLYAKISSSFKPICGYYPVLSNINIEKYISVVLDKSNNSFIFKLYNEEVLEDFILNLCKSTKEGNVIKGFESYILDDELKKNKNEKELYCELNYERDNQINDSVFYLELNSKYNFNHKIINFSFTDDVLFTYNFDKKEIKIDNFNSDYIYNIVLINDDGDKSKIYKIDSSSYQISEQDRKDFSYFYLLSSIKEKHFYKKTIERSINEIITPDVPDVPIIPEPEPCSDCYQDCSFECYEESCDGDYCDIECYEYCDIHDCVGDDCPDVECDMYDCVENDCLEVDCEDYDCYMYNESY